MKVYFFKSDAAAYAYPDEPDEYEIELDHNVQLTYGELRTVGPADLDSSTGVYVHFGEGYPIATLDKRSFWIDRINDYHWSDIAIGDSTWD